MKSIRLSLIVYFLLLIAGAFGGVAALAYRTTAMTLEDKQASTEDLIQAQFQTRCQDARAVLDKRLLHQAQLLASKARTTQVPHPVMFLALAAGSGSGSTSRVVTPLHMAPFFAAPKGDPLANYMGGRLFVVRPFVEIIIPTAAMDAIMPPEDDQQLEVFQTYRRSGAPAQRSATLKNHWLTLSAELRETAEELEGEFDDFQLDGRTMRRVTLKTSTARPFFGIPFRNAGFAAKQKGTAKPSPPGNGSLGWTLFTQYASDTAQLAEQIRGFESARDARLARSAEETRTALADLRRRMFWISGLTFIGIAIGGYLLLRLGLAPLARLSDAVSKVSEKNFQLQIDPLNLPSELRPVAERLGQSLRQLQAAFNREKHAAADISHELRTPLAALMTTLEVGLRKNRTAEEYREILQECRTSGKHMSHLVERLMALARLDAGVDLPTLEPVDVAELAQQCADMVRPLAQEQGLSLTSTLDESIITLTDAGKLREIVLNLLHNAIAYNKPRGSIDVTAVRDNGHITLAVRDTGIGIDREAQTHLFERFFRADPSRHADTPHCGLGLAIVKSYVDLLEGTIRVESSEAGTLFQVRLPDRNPEEAEATDREPQLQTAP